MYELRNGSARLICALDRVKEDPAAVAALAKILGYLPEQLTQDITAANDLLTKCRIAYPIEEKRRERLQWLWDNETNEDETQEWREDLTPEEEAMVDLWDDGYTLGAARMVEGRG